MQRRAMRSGFALLAVLWVIVTATVIALSAQLVVRTGVSAAHNRISLVASAWRTEECVERTRSVFDGALQDHTLQRSRLDPWLSLDDVLHESTAMRGCGATLSPGGLTVDVNEADEEQLRRLFVVLGHDRSRADSLTQAVLDWRDQDDVRRPLGAEQRDYGSAAVVRNGPFASINEVSQVRGFQNIPGLYSVLGIESGRIFLRRAKPVVVASIPGFTDEAVEAIVRWQRGEIEATDLSAFAALLSASARDSLLGHYATISLTTTLIPEFWILRTHCPGPGSGDPESSLEIRFARATSRVAVVRRQSFSGLSAIDPRFCDRAHEATTAQVPPAD